MIELYEPSLAEMGFREKLLGDEATMAYNHAWGGVISFPPSQWAGWYDHWLIHHDSRRFYRYLRDTETLEFVGETAYHLDAEKQLWLADVIVHSAFRRKGFGAQGLRLLCQATRERGVSALYDDIAIDNPGIRLFLRFGFREVDRTDQIILLKKELLPSPSEAEKEGALP